jgi:hypothetical protein
MKRYGKTVCDSPAGFADPDFRRGLRELLKHRPDLAVKSLRKAAASCPAERPEELSKKLYWLSLALFRLDRPELALKALASAQKLRPRGISRAAYLRRVNEYGMLRRSSPVLDDFYAFYSIHSCAYLSRKRSGRYDSPGEKDAVVRLIGDAWRVLSGSGRLSGLGPTEKLIVFKEWPIAFPVFGAARIVHADASRIDFRRGRRQDCDGRCSCGSGLPYRQCCGRIASPSEQFCE